MLEEPMTDEGYSFREPTLINRKKGWNKVRVKLPVGTFRGKDRQNPVKWIVYLRASGDRQVTRHEYKQGRFRKVQEPRVPPIEIIRFFA